MPSKFLLFLIAEIFLASAWSCHKDQELNSDDPPVLKMNYPIVDTGQKEFYNESSTITEPGKGAAFYGQDAMYNENEPEYIDNGDGTVSDLLTGLMWSRSTDLNGDGTINAADKLSYDEAMESATSFVLGGYDDWRIPTIKELYSLILFSGMDISGPMPESFVPFIDTEYFEFGYGDEYAGERLIDAQYASSTLYSSTTMNGDETMFGVNFADGRIKGYGLRSPDGNTDKKFYVIYVRGNTEYGLNDFIDNEDGTITDLATGLMWMKEDNAKAVSWKDALYFGENFEWAGYDDWRLPNAKELQSIVDYTRSLVATGSAAIDPIFQCSTITDEGGNENYPFYWTSTTHANISPFPGGSAVYVCFGEALGWMSFPPLSGNYTLLDVHGAGAQRSDPKTGNVSDYPYGHGPQGDVVRIDHFVRLVRKVKPGE